MANRFTYRELTLLAGVVVALIIAFTIWFRQPVTTTSGKPKVTGTSFFSTIKNETIKKYFTAFLELP